MSVIRATQEAVAATLLADPAVLALVAKTDLGPAVFAPGAAFPDAYPRITLEAPQRIPRASACGRSAEMAVTIHCWADGAAATLTAGALADAAGEALDRALSINGWRVSSWSFEDSRPVGDPSEGVEHFVVRHRYSVQQTA